MAVARLVFECLVIEMVAFEWVLAKIAVFVWVALVRPVVLVVKADFSGCRDVDYINFERYLDSYWLQVLIK